MSFLVEYGETSSESSVEEPEDIECDSKNFSHGSTDKKNNSGTINNKNKRNLSTFSTGCGEEDTPPRKKMVDDKCEDITNEIRKTVDTPSENQHLFLPSSIHAMFQKKQTWVDKPSDHGFRVRSFPHVEGNWATHVYIPVPQNEKFTNFVKNVLKVFMPLEFHPMSEHHISLSRTVVIRHHWIEALVDSLRENLSCLNSCLADIASVKLYTNDEKTRTFVCLVLPSEDTLFMDYTNAVDKSFADFKLPPFYKDPSFHISIGWCLGDVRHKISNDALTKSKKDYYLFFNCEGCKPETPGQDNDFVLTTHGVTMTRKASEASQPRFPDGSSFKPKPSDTKICGECDE